MVRRSAKIALRVAGVALGVLVLVGGFLTVWVMNGGSLGLGFVNSQLESMINAGLKGFQLHLGDGALRRSDDGKLVHLQFSDVEAVDLNGNVIARVPKANLSLSGPAFSKGEVAPTRVELIGASAMIVRRADGGVQLGLQVGEDKPDEPASKTSPGIAKAMLEAMLTPKADDTLSRYLTRFVISDAKLTLFDEETKSYWTAEKASLAFDRKPNGVVVSVNAPVKLPDKSTWLFTAAERYTSGNEHVALEAAFKPVRLKLLAAGGMGLKAFAGFDIPVAGNATCDLLMTGQLGRCKFWLNADAGSLKLPALKPDPIVLKTAALTVEMDFPQKRYSIEEMTWAGKTIRGKVTGDGAFSFAPDGAFATLTADWAAKDISIDAPNVFDGGLALESANFRGAFDAASKTLTIEQIRASRGPFELTLAGSLKDDPGSMGVVLNGQLKDLSIANLKRLWPAGAAPGAREWVLANAHEGIIRSGTINVNIAPGAIVGGRIPDEMMNIGLSLDSTRITYLSGLPDMTNVRGTVTALGDTFKMDIAGGNVGRLNFSSGSFVIPELHKQGTIGTISGTVVGPTNDLLLLIDKPRLGYPSKYGIKAAEAGGSTNAKFAFTIPMLRDLKADDVGINVDGEFKDVKLPLPIGEQLRLTGGVFVMNLTEKGFKAHGAVQVNTAPMGFTWTEDFTGTAAVGTRIDVTATLNTAQRAALGVDLAGYIEGKTSVVAVFLGRGGKFSNGQLDVNLTGARLAAPQVNWAKPEDANATMKANVVFRPGKLIELTNIDAVGPGMKAQGRLLVSSSGIREADFKKLQLGPRNDFVLSYRDSPETGLLFDTKGRAIDASGFLEGQDPANRPGAKQDRRRPTTVKADMDMAYLQGDVWFTGVKFDYGSDGTNLTAFKVDASADAANVRGDLVRGADGSRKLRLQTADAGRLVRGLTGFRSMIGGNLTLSADLAPMPAQGSAAAGYDGTLKIEKFKIVNQPFFARLLAAGSFTGLDDLMRGEGITFTRCEQVFQGRGDVITVQQGVAQGPAIGLTTRGTINRVANKIDLNGTIVPLYGLNSMFSDVPLIGDILGSRDGEGIFGVTYGVAGPVEDMKVAVNPVSMLAPGFLRKIFQMGPSPQAATPMATPQAKPETQKGVQPEPKTN